LDFLNRFFKQNFGIFLNFFEFFIIYVYSLPIGGTGDPFVGDDTTDEEYDPDDPAIGDNGEESCWNTMFI
jgi:hypothetical protein